MTEIGPTETAEFATALRVLRKLAADAHQRAGQDPEWQARRDDYLRRARELDPEDRAAVTHVLSVDIADYRKLPNPTL